MITREIKKQKNTEVDLQNEKKVNKFYLKFFSFLRVYFFFLLLFVIVGIGKIQKMDFLSGSKIFVVGIVVTSLFTTVLQYTFEKGLKNLPRKEHKKRYISSVILLGIVYTLAVGMVFLSSIISVKCLWMLGGMILGIVLNSYYGIVLLIFTNFFYCFTMNMDLEFFAIYFFLSVGLCLLSPYLRQISTIGYVVVIGVLGNCIALILNKNFNLTLLFTIDSLLDILSIFFVIVAAAFVSWVYKSYCASGDFSFIRTDVYSFFKEEEAHWDQEKMITIEKLTKNTMQSETERHLKEMQNEKYALLQQLKKQKPEVFSHSKHVAFVGQEIAERLKIDKQLVYVAGLYHEIGRLKKGNYVEEGILLGLEHKFPSQVTRLIEEHNIKHKVPTSKEAAVLMLTDSVVFMKEQIKKNPEKYSKLPLEYLKGIFKMRYESGALDQSGLTIQELRVIEKYFQDFL